MSIDPNDDSLEHEAEIIDLTAPRRGAAPEPAPPADDDADGPRVLVDSPEAQRPERLDARTAALAERRPILAAWLRSRAELRVTATWAARYAAHITAFHAVRVPTVYLGRLTLRSPQGGWHVARAVFRWVTDWEGHPVRLATVEQIDAAAYLRLSKQRDDRVRVRAIVALVVAVLLAVPAVLLALFGVLWLQVLALVATVAVLGAFGRPPDRPLLDTAVVKPQAAKLTSEMVRRALLSLSIGALGERMAEQITFPAPITRDGPGWRADIDLPHGITAGEVIEKRDKLASGLRRPIGCVWPEPAHDQHAGRLVLWVGDQDMSQTKQPLWPLLKHGAVDLFRPFPFGTDPRGRVVPVTLMFTSAVIGSVPRMGKTFSLRLALLGAALDPTAEMHLYDLKGTGDLGPLEPVAYRYRAGDEEDDLAYALADMRELQAEMRRRTKVIRELPRHLAPESKVTRELVRMRQYRLHPIVIGVDECQRWFEDPERGEDLTAICEDLVKRGPAVGISLILATQRPDARSLPTGISANAVLRFCLKVMSHRENDMVLGGNAHTNGIRATMFTRRDLGIGYLAGEGDDPVIVRTFYVDAPAAERVIIRARALRNKAGTLAGHAIGQEPEAARAAGWADSLLEDILTVVPASEAKVWGETVLERVAEYRPEVYGAWTREQLTAALRSLGIDATEQVWGTDPATGKGANRRGIDRQAVANAATERARRRRQEGPA
jgi:DNA segregation ATPase FtsK/SpoIIIE, S-DNA-T family